MVFRTKLNVALAGLCVAALLAACGGGGDGLVTSAATQFAGTLGGNRDAAAVVLPDGRYYLVYSAAGDANTVGGALQGTATVTNGTFASADTVDFAVAATYAAPKAATVSGVLNASSFTGTETPTTGTAGFALGVRPAVFTVTASGAVTSSINGCAITGTASPRADSDTYDLTITFGGPPCAIQNVSFTGVAYQRPDNGRLYAVARNATLRQSVIFSGVR